MAGSVRTLAVDVGGTGLKATVLSPDGEMVSERVRRETPYPCPPPVLLDELEALAKTQPAYDRVSVGFPGAIRRGRVREVPAFSRRAPGEGPDRKLVAQWAGFEVATDALREPCVLVRAPDVETHTHVEVVPAES